MCAEFSKELETVLHICLLKFDAGKITWILFSVCIFMWSFWSLIFKSENEDCFSVQTSAVRLFPQTSSEIDMFSDLLVVLTSHSSEW